MERFNSALDRLINNFMCEHSIYVRAIQYTACLYNLYVKHISQIYKGNYVRLYMVTYGNIQYLNMSSIDN